MVDRITQIDLTFNHIFPRRGAGILEVCHEASSTRIERVYYHLSIDGAGDLNSTVEKILRDLGNAPFAFTNRLCFGEKIRLLAGIEFGLTSLSGRQQFETPLIESPLQFNDEIERCGREDLIASLADRGPNIDASGHRYCGTHVLRSY